MDLGIRALRRGSAYARHCSPRSVVEELDFAPLYATLVPLFWRSWKSWRSWRASGSRKKSATSYSRASSCLALASLRPIMRFLRALSLSIISTPSR